MIQERVLKTGEKILIDDTVIDDYPDMHTHYFDEETQDIDYNGDSDERISPFCRTIIASDYHIDEVPCLVEYYSLPLIKYLSENHHPHCTAIVTNTSVELLEGIRSIRNIIDFIKD